MWLRISIGPRMDRNREAKSRTQRIRTVGKWRRIGQMAPDRDV
jgi:hypothetical protein